MLREGEWTARDISRRLGIREKEVYEHLPHVEKSLGSDTRLIAQPARCLDCGFVFRKRTRFTTPGKCPVCRSEAISAPVYGIQSAGMKRADRLEGEAWPARQHAAMQQKGYTMEKKQTSVDCDAPTHENLCEFEEDALIPTQDDRIKAAVLEMVRSCKDDRTVDHVGAALIPSKDEIIRILDILQDILFPGFFGRQELTHATLEYHLGNEMTTLFELLSAQISRSIRHECRRMDSLCVKCVRKGREEAVTFLERLPWLRKTLAQDVRAHFDGDPASKSLDEIVFCYPGLYAIFVYRVAHELFVRGIPLMPRIMTEHAHSRTGIDIHPGATIGADFFIDHGTGVVIGETTEIGARVRIYQGVTLGALSVPRESEGGTSLRGKKRHPTIEDNVTIYAQATILGGETVIGARCVIGGNVWLTSSVPPDTTVFIEPPQHIFREDDTFRKRSDGRTE
jgi:serine O-acetyltransferase